MIATRAGAVQPQGFAGVACAGGVCLTAQQIAASGQDWRSVLRSHPPSLIGERRRDCKFCKIQKRPPTLLEHCPNRTRHFQPCKMHSRKRASAFPLACSPSEGEESFVLDYFFGGLLGKPQRGGVFLELGAHDGLSMANSIHFEECLGWRGLLVEGQPSLFPRLTFNRPRSMLLRAAVCKIHGVENFTTRSDVLGGIQANLAKSHVRRHKMRARDVEPVACAPLGDWLSLLRFTRIDLMYLDVEGSERLVLETLDWSNFAVRVLLVECAGSGHHGCLDPRDTQIVSLLATKGLDLITALRARHDIWDMVFLNRSWTSPWDPPRGWAALIADGPPLEAVYV